MSWYLPFATVIKEPISEIKMKKWRHVLSGCANYLRFVKESFQVLNQLPQKIYTRTFITKTEEALEVQFTYNLFSLKVVVHSIFPIGAIPPILMVWWYHQAYPWVYLGEEFNIS
ncbi:hypothetical protein CEXT_759541 [Caerostris extrusa]|uniref:Uncharacterized protein n=1 Tax=Caerostris extrusa TaxID=172846 RepID=A0AAV4MDH6_CAEEX|nr:hypothetical protein CEXT_759541 [Caerostris extrusa]